MLRIVNSVIVIARTSLSLAIGIATNLISLAQSVNLIAKLQILTLLLLLNSYY